jgi:Bacterial alpha-L-rhamnosidase 6 hairpin glycosidase domain/Alpha-L-rhamnosidase N-terminal domain/Bacterial alpha-L-rhamnosidase concanavalin-like domain/Bacterial alpha-L-rhamnosidase C-terminal domain
MHRKTYLYCSNSLFPANLMRILALIATLAGTLCAEPTPTQPPSATPTRLRCEYLVNPLGLDVTQPRLDWILTSADTSLHNLNQTSYQILVASTPEVLARDQGDLWDSGVVKSDETDHIVYGGPALKSREACYWKVRITDSLGGTSAWSQPASWEMGLLQPDDWQAKWIEVPKIIETTGPKGTVTILHASYEATDGTSSKDVTDLITKKVQDNTLAVPVNNDELGGDPALRHVKHLVVTYTLDGKQAETTADESSTLTIPESRSSFPYLRKDFALTHPIAKARLYATALGLYELRLNGQRVGDHIFAPDWTDYFKRSRYQDYDVTSLVKTGANTLGALVGNGWYCGHIGNGGFQAWGKIPALFGQLEVTYTDGTVERIVTDASWKKHAGPITDSDFMLGEDYNAQKEIADWDQLGLDVSDWIAVDERTEAARPLDGQVDQPVRQTGERHPLTMTEAKPGHWIYDLGQNMVGFVRLNVSAPAGTKLKLRHAEMLNADGTIYTTNLRGAPSIDTYVCKGGGVETWQPHFTFHGFRYVELTGLPQPPTKESVTGIVIGTDIPRTGEFSCSNPDINQLQSNIQWGMRGNYLAVPTDCPQRNERMGWMGDAQVFIRTATYNGDVAAFFTKWLVDVDDAQGADGRFTDVSPSPIGKGGEPGGVPAWGDAGVICPWTIYLMYGDKRILEQHLPAMKRWIDWCQAHTTNLIRDHDRGPDYGDWLSQGESTPKDMIGTAYFAYSTALVAKSCEITGDTDGAAKYGDLATQIKAAFNQRYVQPDGKTPDNTQAGYAMALRFHLLPDDVRPKAAQFLEDNVKAHNDHLTTGFVGVSYLLPALSSENKIDTAYRLLLQDTFPSWLFSVKQGATTIWERWDGWTPDKGFQNPGMNSFNHYSLGSCGEWMFDTVAGIGVDPDHPGFHHILIHPRPGGNLTHAEASFDSIHGKITTKWTLAHGNFSLDVTIPINTTATVELPSSTQVTTLPVIKPETNAQFEIGSGDYHFTCQLP